MVGSPRTAGRASRTRSRSGCLSCRLRRRKCDGARPHCRNCLARGDRCRWGLKLSFHPSRELQLSSEHNAALVAIEEERTLFGAHSPNPATIVDDTEHVVRGYGCQHCHGPHSSIGCLDAEHTIRLDTPRLVDDGPSSTHPSIQRSANVACGEGEDLNVHDSTASDGTIPHSIDSDPSTTHYYSVIDGERSFEGLSPSTQLRQLNQNSAHSTGTFIPPFFLGQAVSLNASPLPERELPVSRVEQTPLIFAYLHETGTWCETADSSMHFTVAEVHHMMDNRAFAAAAMALASRHLDAVQNRHRQITLRLYQHAIQLLIHQDPSQVDATVLATCTLLCVYEMMAANVSEWRRHLKGCAGLLRSNKWNGSSPGIISACFWAFARIDIWAAYMIEEETLMPTNDWVDDSAVRSVAANSTIDAYCNLATLIFAKIVNFTAKAQKKAASTNDQALRINELWRDLQDWRTCRPRKALPLLRGEAPQKKPFETIMFTNSSSICGNTFYHAGSILLLQTGRVLRDRAEAETEKYNPVWHARELGGISTSNTSHANWVNHLQPLYIAGKALPAGAPERQSTPSCSLEDVSSSDENYSAEKIALLRHLAKIERETGWKTSERAAELRQFWGFA